MGIEYLTFGRRKESFYCCFRKFSVTGEFIVLSIPHVQYVTEEDQLYFHKSSYAFETLDTQTPGAQGAQTTTKRFPKQFFRQRSLSCHFSLFLGSSNLSVFKPESRNYPASFISCVTCVVVWECRVQRYVYIREKITSLGKDRCWQLIAIDIINRTRDA